MKKGRGLKIGMVCYPTYGGSGVMAVELAQALGARGHEIHLMSMHPPARWDQYAPGVIFHEITEMSGWPFDHSWYDVALTNMIVELARGAALDLVHVHYAMPHAVSAYLAKQILQAEGRRLPVVTTLHGTDVTLVSEHQSFEQVMRFVMQASDGLAAVSDNLADTTVRQMRLTRAITVIPNGVDTQKFRPIRPNPRLRMFAAAKGPMLMHVSNFRPLKRVMDVVGIFARVRAQTLATLALVGDGPEYERVTAAVKREAWGRDVLFLGKQAAVETLLPCASVVLLPSAQESFGLAALEAMACGVPVVASRVGGLPEVVEHGRQGFLEPVGDVEAMARRCLDLLRQPRWAARLGAAGRRRAVTRFGLGLMASRYERYYREVLRKSKRK